VSDRGGVAEYASGGNDGSRGTAATTFTFTVFARTDEGKGVDATGVVLEPDGVVSAIAGALSSFRGGGGVGDGILGICEGFSTEAGKPDPDMAMHGELCE
jgi:hypothetical protein